MKYKLFVLYTVAIAVAGFQLGHQHPRIVEKPFTVEYHEQVAVDRPVLLDPLPQTEAMKKIKFRLAEAVPASQLQPKKIIIAEAAPEPKRKPKVEQ